MHTFINWLKYSVTSQRGMGFPLPCLCVLYSFHYYLMNVLWHTIYLGQQLWGALCSFGPHLCHPLDISQINHIPRLRQCSLVLKRKKRARTRCAGGGFGFIPLFHFWSSRPDSQPGTVALPQSTSFLPFRGKKTFSVYCANSLYLIFPEKYSEHCFQHRQEQV